MPQPVAYIAVVEEPTAALLAKIKEKHNVTFDEVCEAVVLTPVIGSGWNNDDERGWRLYVVGSTYSERRLYVVLYPVDQDDGIWRLGTAMDEG